MHAGQKVKTDENASAQGFHRAAVMYRHVHGGMSAKRVRRLLGKPYDVERFNDVGGREVCWYYGDVFAGEETVNVALARGVQKLGSRLIAGLGWWLDTFALP